jgi:hypothetical protein
MVRPVTRILVAATVAGSIAAGAQVSAHETNVHQLITKAALDYLVLLKPKLEACRAADIREILDKAVVDEDDSTVWPNGRYLFHFLPRLDDTVDVNDLISVKVQASCTSAQWGLQPNSEKVCSQGRLAKIISLSPPIVIINPPIVDTLDNTYTFDAGAIRQLSATPNDPSKRRGLESLGRLLHLLQDLTSPAHAANDAHPHAPFVTSLGDPSTLEVFGERWAKGRNEIDSPIPPIEAITSESNAFETLQRFVSSNYLSEKAVLALDPLTTKTDDRGFIVNTEGRQAVLGPEGRFTITESIADEQLNRLAARAVAYTAELIRWVHENRAPVCEEQLQVTVKGTGRVVSSSDGFRTAPNDALNCTTDCQHYFPSGKSVTLTAVPTNPQQTVTWAGCQASGFTCTLPMDDVAAKTVTATFTAGQVPLTITQSSSQYPGTPGSGSSPGCPNTDLSISVSFSAPVPYVSIAEALNAGAQIFGTGVGTGQGINYHGTQCQFELSTVGPETYNVWFTKNTLGILGIPNNIGISAVTSGTWNITPTGITYSGVYIQDFGAPQVGTISFSITGDIGVAGTTGASASH